MKGHVCRNDPVLRSRLDTTTAGAMDASHNTYVDSGERGKGSHEKGGDNLHLERFFHVTYRDETSVLLGGTVMLTTPAFTLTPSLTPLYT